MTLNRVGYGAMQLAGRDGNKLVWGPPRDIDAAIALLRGAVASPAKRANPELGLLTFRKGLGLYELNLESDDDFITSRHPSSFVWKLENAKTLIVKSAELEKLIARLNPDNPKQSRKT